MRTSKFLAVGLATAFGVIGCDRTAKNKIINGTDAITGAAEAASVQAVEDVWTMTAFGSALGAAFAAPSPAPIAPPDGVIIAAPAAGFQSHTALCQSALVSGGFSANPSSTDGYYTISRSPGGGFSGSFRIAFLSGTAGQNICNHPTPSIDGLGLKVAGTMGFGNTINLNLTFTNFNVAPTLNGTISGSATGQLFQMKFTNCVYNSQTSKTPTSGSWTGSFGSGSTGVCLLTMNFSSTGGKGSMICGTGRNYIINISATTGALTIS